MRHAGKLFISHSQPYVANRLQASKQVSQLKKIKLLCWGAADLFVVVGLWRLTTAAALSVEVVSRINMYVQLKIFKQVNFYAKDL